MPKVIKVYSSCQGRISLWLEYRHMGKDLLLNLHGGEAHIGAVALAVPRPSKQDPRKGSADASVLCVCGHKEDLLARDIALRVSAALGVTVCVACGIHFDGLTTEECDAVLQMAQQLTTALLTDCPHLPN